MKDTCNCKKGSSISETINQQPVKIISSHCKLVEFLARKVSSKYNSCWWITESDLESAGYESLLRAANSYDPLRKTATFTTYAARCIWRDMTKEINELFPINVSERQRNTVRIFHDDTNYSEEKKHKSVFDEFDMTMYFSNWDEEQGELIDTLRKSIAMLEPEEQFLIKQRHGFYGNEATLKELAKPKGITLQAVSKQLKKANDKLYRLVIDNSSSYCLCA